MHPEYGHFRASFGGHHFDFIPSFEAMSKIGNNYDIMSVFSRLFLIEPSEYVNSFENHSSVVMSMLSKVSGKRQLEAAHLVLSCCCDADCSPMIGKYIFKDKIYYQPGFAHAKEIIALAQHLIKHGMVGETKNKVANRKSEGKSEFSPSRFVELARLHLDMSRDEAWGLTMTEFVNLWVTKFPPSEKEEAAAMDSQEYKEIMAELESIRNRTLEKNNG